MPFHGGIPPPSRRIVGKNGVPGVKPLLGVKGCFPLQTNKKVCLFCKLGNNCLFGKSHCFEKNT